MTNYHLCQNQLENPEKGKAQVFSETWKNTVEIRKREKYIYNNLQLLSYNNQLKKIHKNN